MAKHATGNATAIRGRSKSRFKFHDGGVKHESWLFDIDEKRVECVIIVIFNARKMPPRKLNTEKTYRKKLFDFSEKKKFIDFIVVSARSDFARHHTKSDFYD